MAIRRCPYCKAIIDEADKYCNNCGTQLLFPEDEYVEEEIPGDKIIEEDEESEEEGGEEEEIEEEEEEIESGEEEEEEFKEELEETEEEEDLTTETFGAEEEEETTEDIERAGGKPRREFVRPPEEEELRKKYEVALEDNELIFKTKDLEGLTKTVEEGKKEVDRFIASARDKGEEEAGEEAGETEEIPGREETKDDLPPWASGMKGVPPEVIEAGDEEGGEKTASAATTSQGWTADSGIGVPESITQAGIPATGTPEAEKAGVAIEEEEAEEEEEELEREREEEKREEELEEELKEEMREERGLKKEVRIKAKFVDLVFITALWLISLWFTAEVIDVSFFQLFAKSPLPVFGFYLILLLLYFFLFLYFLGETLGDHYFSEEE
ncbi:MAG: zinc ribbon domain-containing protein [Clostridiales bacterium]|nr:zinc ribbon domain-containing protein [Clostridiales bacterium]